MARITVQGIDQRILELRRVVDRTTANLVELESDMTRQLLETSTSLRGSTAAAWADASWRHAELWRGQFALDNLLTRITEERGTRKSPTQATLVRLAQLLEEPCVELSRPDGEGRPSLTEGPAPTVALSVDDVLARMSADYDIVAGLVAAVANIWGDGTERLQEVAAQVSALEARVLEQQMRPPGEPQSIGRMMAEVASTAHEDPLALDPDALSQLESRVAQLQVSVDDAMRRRGERMADLGAADMHIRAAVDALGACREQLNRSAEKVVVRDETWADLDRSATDLDVLRRDVEVQRQLDDDRPLGGLRGRAEALQAGIVRLAVADRGRLERRDELRGLLGAYLAKAQAIGLAENRELDDMHSAARDALYSAPCDLEEAERLCEVVQHFVRPRAVETS